MKIHVIRSEEVTESFYGEVMSMLGSFRGPAEFIREDGNISWQDDELRDLEWEDDENRGGLKWTGNLRITSKGSGLRAQGSGLKAQGSGLKAQVGIKG